MAKQTHPISTYTNTTTTSVLRLFCCTSSVMKCISAWSKHTDEVQAPDLLHPRVIHGGAEGADRYTARSTTDSCFSRQSARPLEVGRRGEG
jgi:hypothetical protein